MYEVLISNEAEKYYNSQDKDIKRRLNKCVANLSIVCRIGNWFSEGYCSGMGFVCQQKCT